VILSPTGTHPDGFNTSSGNFCAWHDWNGDLGVSSSYGDIAFHNMPYVSDMGSSCGTSSVRDVRDGFSIVDGHEYAELITDQNPAGGWTATSGQENADECAWITSGQGAQQLVTMGNGSYPMQSTWSNDTNRCDISHPIVGGSGGGALTASFSVSTSGLTANFTDSSSDTYSGATITGHSWNFGDGTSSTATNPSHTYAATGSYTVTETVTDSQGHSANTSKSVSVSSGGGSSQLLGNTGFESGTASPWTMSSGVLCSNSSCSGETAHAGSWFAWLDGYGSSHSDTVSQSVAIPAGKTSATLAFYLHIDTSETTTSTAYDTLKVQVVSGTTTTTLATYSNLNKASGYVLKSLNMNAYIGKTVTVKFVGTEDSSLQTSFVLDDITLTVQ
jgi:serine protease